MVQRFSGLPARIKKIAHEAGFDLCGLAAVRDFSELNVFPEWIADGRHGEMKYMAARDEAGELKRAALARVAPWARSVIVCAINYNTAQPYSTQTIDASRGWISRYAWSREDYHDAVLQRLRDVEERVRKEVANSARRPSAAKAVVEGTGPTAALKRCATPNQSFSAACESMPSPNAIPVSGASPVFGADSSLDPPITEHVFRCYVDTGPLVERVYAKYAGIGWIGKNTCIINQKLGSWLFLGVILTSMELANSLSSDAPASDFSSADLPAPDRCGTCTRCIVACPTQAITAPGELDARLCISYLTIEKRGEISEGLRAGMGRHVFGCDICQDVCPWNRKAPVTAAEEFQPREGLVNPALEWLAEMEPDEFRAVFRGSPVRRAKLSGLRRNAAIAMGNSGDEKFVPTLKKIAGDQDAVVAEHARWALGRMKSQYTE
jgi:epoxyqueuosine reductase